jgi:hypothetical protein
MLLAEEYFASEHEAFLETLRRVDQPKALAALADRWKQDPRPWARAQIFTYLALPLNAPGHQPVVKRLFKHAEAAGDHELMAAFLVGFDRHVRRQIHRRRSWDLRTRTASEEERLVTPRDVIPLTAERPGRTLPTGGRITAGARQPQLSRLFKYRTRYYLRRRAWRYFRHLGHRDPAAYRGALLRALTTYQDADLQRGENILDSWGLMHACFGAHDALEFGATHIQLKAGRGLGELSPAPCFPEAWKTAEAAPLLLALAVQARARLVRVWARQLFQREHATHAVPLEAILSLLEHDDPELQQFGAKLLESSSILGTLPVAAWLRLLQTRNEEALQGICDAFVSHVSGERLDLAQCLQLACARPVPVAGLGQRFLRARSLASAAGREELTALADAQCPAVAGELATWALGILGTKENYACDQVIRFFDSASPEIRTAAWAWLVADSPALGAAALWSRLTETPYDDLRLRLIDFLQRHTELPGAGPDPLTGVWRAVLLGVHRGGRQKAKAVQQIARAISEDPQCGDALLPVLAVAVRSVRGPEARAGLAAIARVLEDHPALAEAVGRHLPELKCLEASA